MVSSCHHDFSRGDVLARSFSTPPEEAEWIAETISEMVGDRYVNSPSSDARGLSYSDFAILFRTSASAEETVHELRSRQIPFVIKGFGSLFDASEVQAAVGLFQYIVDELPEDDLRELWQSDELHVTDGNMADGLEVLDEAKQWEDDKRWSAYNIQRTYLRFLEAIKLREDGPNGLGEVAFYNLGKFSEAISEFEEIHFSTNPQDKYQSFVYWLENEAPHHFEDVSDSGGWAQINAVQIMTIHQSKGLEWPVVFIPALQKNRFPSKKQGGRNKWHILPKDAVHNSDRYDGSVEDERRLFYVALTRAEKFAFCSFAPGSSKMYGKPSEFFTEMTKHPLVMTKAPPRKNVQKLTPRERIEVPNVTLSFSEIKYFFECPYQFKLRFMYGFNPPIHEALGYGKSLHDALAEIHSRAIQGDIVSRDEVEKLVDDHLHAPFAYPALRDELRKAAIASLHRFLEKYGDSLEQTEHSEQPVEISVGDGITVNGRIDLIKRLETEEVSIVDFKSSERAQEEDVTRSQLHTYAMGYEDLTGENADLLEVLNLDEAGQDTREVVDDEMLTQTRERIKDSGEALRDNRLERLPSFCSTCESCELVGICRDKPET